MSLSFALWSLIAVLAASFCIGTGLKLWIHRHGAVVVALSPIWCMLLLVVIPVVTFGLLVFVPEKFDGVAKRTPKTSQMSYVKRFSLGLWMWVAFVRYYPIVLGVFATMMSFILDELNITQKASKLYEGVVDVACQYTCKFA